MDSSGDSFTTSDGKVSITVPAGAVSEPTSISVTEGHLDEIELMVGPGQEQIVVLTNLGPEDHVFDQPVTVRLRWDDSAPEDGFVDGFPSLAEGDLMVWQDDVPAGPCDHPAYDIVQGNCLSICCDMAENEWILTVDHFSQFGVGLQLDADTDGELDTVDQCVSVDPADPPSSPPDQNPAKSKIIFKKLDDPVKRGIVAKGFFNPATMSPAVDPATHGVHIRLADSQRTFYDLNVPGGLRQDPPVGHCDASDGWKNPNPTTWKYINKSGALPPECEPGSARGLVKVLVKDLRTKPKNAFKYVIKTANDAELPRPEFPVTRMQLDVALGAWPSADTASAQAVGGQCLESVFEGDPNNPEVPQTPRDENRQKQAFCKQAPKDATPATRKKVICKGL
jgi:hypothetical protein